VDYSTTMFRDSPLIFGANGWPTLGSTPTQTAALGMKWSRTLIGADVLLPTTTVSAYLSALSGGCTSGSVCDPSTWHWTSMWDQADIGQAQSQGIPVVLSVYTIPSWLSAGGTIAGFPSNLTVWADVIKKIYQHYNPAYMDVWNEPDLSDSTGYGSNQAAYNAIYNSAASALRSLSSTVQLGGPAICCSDPRNWIPQFLSAATTPPNFVSYHSYQTANNELFQGVNVVQEVQAISPGMPIWLEEWNADPSCTDTLGAGDGNPATVPFFGMRLVNSLNIGLTAAGFWSTNETLGDRLVGCTWMLNGIIDSKARTVEIMSVILGLGVGNFTLVKSSQTGVTTAMGALNSVNQHVAVVVNDSGSPAIEVVSLANTGFSSGVTWKTWIASTLVDPASGPVETVPVTPVSGTVTHTISLPANSVAGVLIQ